MSEENRNEGIVVIILGLLLSLPVAAQTKGGLGLLFGPEGEIEVDSVTTGGQKFDGAKEDTKKNFGFHAWFEGQPSGNAVFGGRAAYTGTNGDDSDNDYSFVDVGLWSRFTLGPGATEISLVGSAGVTYGMVEGESEGADLEGSGIGWHVLAGPMISLNAGTLPINLSVFYSYTSIGTVDVEVSSGGSKAEGEFEDVVFSRVTASVGVNF